MNTTVLPNFHVDYNFQIEEGITIGLLRYASYATVPGIGDRINTTSDIESGEVCPGNVLEVRDQHVLIRLDLDKFGTIE